MSVLMLMSMLLSFDKNIRINVAAVMLYNGEEVLFTEEHMTVLRVAPHVCLYYQHYEMKISQANSTHIIRTSRLRIKLNHNQALSLLNSSAADRHQTSTKKQQVQQTTTDTTIAIIKQTFLYFKCEITSDANFRLFFKTNNKFMLRLLLKTHFNLKFCYKL